MALASLSSSLSSLAWAGAAAIGERRVEERSFPCKAESCFSSKAIARLRDPAGSTRFSLGSPAMTTIRVTAETPLAPEQVLRAARDFSSRRAEVFPAVSMERMEVHELGDTSADVTEGTSTGIGVNWERCHYDWSREGIVTATVTDSNVYAVPGSSWEITARLKNGATEVEMAWIREFRHGLRGRLFGTAFRLFGNRIFRGYGQNVIENLERLEGPGSS